MRLLLYTGKGGVGKTTTAAATAALAARRGLRTLVLSADAAHSLGDVLDCALTPSPRQVAPRLDAVEIDARHEIAQHWGRVRAYLVDLLRYQGVDEVVAEELALLPGADELATLVAVQEWSMRGAYDLIVVDCAPTGSTLRLLTLPEVAHAGLRWLLRLHGAAARAAEPIMQSWVGVPLPKAEVFAETDQLFYETLSRLRARLLSRQTSVRLVVTPESMAIAEARRSLTDLALFELPSDAVVMNRMLPDEALQQDFFREWGRIQIERRREVEETFAPMATLSAPLAEDEVRGVEALADHGAALFAGLDPAARLGCRPGLRFERVAEGGRLRLPVSGYAASSLEVARIDQELMVGVAGRRRRIALPAGLAALEVQRVAVEEGELVVSFAEAKPAAALRPSGFAP